MCLLLAGLLAAPLAAAVERAVCDVCHEAEEPVAVRIAHGDHVHRFCSEKCAAAYRANPSAYHAKPAGEVAARASQAGSAAPSCPV